MFDGSKLVVLSQILLSNSVLFCAILLQESEAKMYQLLQKSARKSVLRGGTLSAPGLTYISVGHRPSLLAYHDKRLRLRGDNEHDMSDIEKVPTDLSSAVSNL